MAAHKEEAGSVVGFKGAERITNEELLQIKCDVLVPAALENQITLKNASRVRARVVAEAANGPTTPGADRVLSEHGVFVVPDILCNAGGVTASYFEWVQNLQGLSWEEAQVHREVERLLKRAFQRSWTSPSATRWTCARPPPCSRWDAWPRPRACAACSPEGDRSGRWHHLPPCKRTPRCA